MNKVARECSETKEMNRRKREKKLIYIGIKNVMIFLECPVSQNIHSATLHNKKKGL